MTPNPPPALTFHEVCFAWTKDKKTEVFTDLTFSIEQGESVALLGANGSGKTTLLLLASGCLFPQRGTITVDGITISSKTISDARRRMGMVFQDADDQLFCATVLEDAAFGLLTSGVDPEEAKQKAEETLCHLGAESLSWRAPHQLSGGEKRRAALAGVLVMKPTILLFDEPTSGLDARGKLQLKETLNGLSPAKLIAAHDLEFAMSVCQRALILADGKIAAYGPITDILADDILLRRHGLKA